MLYSIVLLGGCTTQKYISQGEDNIAYKQEDLREFYRKLFGQALADYNAGKKRPYQRIPDNEVNMQMRSCFIKVHNGIEYFKVRISFFKAA